MSNKMEISTKRPMGEFKICRRSSRRHGFGAFVALFAFATVLTPGESAGQPEVLTAEFCKTAAAQKMLGIFVFSDGRIEEFYGTGGNLMLLKELEPVTIEHILGVSIMVGRQNPNEICWKTTGGEKCVEYP